MKTVLEDLYGKATEKVGVLGTLLPSLAENIKINLNDENIDQVNEHLDEIDRHCDEAIEAAKAVKAANAQVRVHVADGEYDLSEMALDALAYEHAADELEDVATGHDEDDESRTGTGAETNPPDGDS